MTKSVNEKAYIYVLKDPRDGQIRYVGKTIDITRRLQRHIYDSRKHKKYCHNQRWVNKVLESGLKPEIEVIEEVDFGKWKDRERFWIKYFKECGAKLTNVTEGGEGVDISNRSKEWYKKVVYTRRIRGNFRPSKDVIDKTRKTNLERTEKFCKNGHLRTKDNTVIMTDKRGKFRCCLECESNRRKRNRKTKDTNEFPEDTRRTKEEFYHDIYGNLKQWHDVNGFPKKEFCKRGHPMSGNNLRILVRTRYGITKEERICRECVRIRNRASKRRKAVNR